MARKKETPKPMSAVKADFIASLDNLTGKGIMLLTVVETFLKNAEATGVKIQPGVRRVLEKQCDEFRAALVEPLEL